MSVQPRVHKVKCLYIWTEFPWKKPGKRSFSNLRHTLKIRISVFQDLENPPLTWLCNLLNSAVSQKRKLLICSTFFYNRLEFPLFLVEYPFLFQNKLPCQTPIPGPSGFLMISLQTLFSRSHVFSIPPKPIDPHIHNSGSDMPLILQLMGVKPSGVN